MNINMNSCRLQTTNSLNHLGEILKDLVNYLPEKHQIDDLIESFDQVASFIGILNCIYDQEDETFSDMSDKEIVRLTEYYEVEQ